MAKLFYKNISLFVILILLTSLFFLALLNTTKAEFIIDTNFSTNTVCPSSTIVFTDTISAISSGSFIVSISGSAANFATIVPQGFWLNAGEQEVVYSYITPSSKITPGSYFLDVTFNQNGKVKTIRHDIIVENCHSTKLSITPSSQNICACDQKSFLLELKNDGNYLETYSVSVEGPAAKWTTLSSTTITLAPNSSTTFNAYVSVPCNLAGDYEVNFVAKSHSNYAQATNKATISVVSCYDYLLSTEKSYYNICEAEKLLVPIKIKNLGNQDNTYKLNLNGPTWVKLESNEVTIEKEKERVVNLIIEPPYKTSGNFTVYLESMSVDGKVLKKTQVTLEVSQCYGVAVLIETDKDKMCNALSNTYSVFIRNMGKFQNNYDIILEAPPWVSISNKKVSLNATEEKPIVLEVAPPYNTNPNNHSIKIRAIDAISKVEATDELIIETVSLEDCYKPAINTKEEKIAVAQDNTATALFIVENKGTNSANYTIELSGTATKFTQVNPSVISLKPGKTQPIYLYIAPSLYTPVGEYLVTITVRLRDTTILASKTITVVITEVPLIETNKTINETISPTNFTIAKKEGTFFSKFLSFFANLFKPKVKTEESNITNETLEKLNYTPTTNTTNATKKDTSKNESQNIDSISKTTNTTSKNRAPILDKEIPQIELTYGEKVVIDLNNYFSDPDDDTLSFVTIKPQNISISLSGSTVTITPQDKFNGTREITFYASDGSNIVQSNTVKIVITSATKTDSKNKTNSTFNSSGSLQTPQKEPINFKRFSKYTPWIIFGVVILIIILIIISGLGKKIIEFFEEEVPTNNKNHKKANGS